MKIGYVTLGTNDLPRAAAFYDELCDALGASRLYESERGIGWGKDRGSPMLAVMKPFDGRPATVGNGSMVALQVDSAATVDAMYALAMRLGASDEGKPGPRGAGFYAAYFRDLDGNKLDFFCAGG